MEGVSQNQLFDDQGNAQSKKTHTISINQMQYVTTKEFEIDELFSGFQDLRVITYSYTIPFIERIMKFFSTGEVIIGTEHNLTRGAAELFAIQQVATNAVTTNKYLQERIKKGEFRFFLTNDVTSHQKLYLLSNQDGKVRTIFGSANMSYTAWQSSQIEDYFFCDDNAFYDMCLEKFIALKDKSTSEIAKSATPVSLEANDIEKIPVGKKIIRGAAVVIEPQTSVETEYVFNINKLTNEYKQSFGDIKPKVSEASGKPIIDAPTLRRMYDRVEKYIAQQKKAIVENPSLILDFSNKTATFDNVPLLLEPDKEEVKENILRFCEYMASFSSFTKDTKKLKQSYWKVLNYMFLSPFIAHLRLNAMFYDYDMRFLPIYLIICGASDAGKTTFVKTVQHLMLNKDITSLNQDIFSGNKIQGAKTTIKGIPVLIDEITPTHWKYADDVVKMDDSSLMAENKLNNHPTFILTSNKIKTLKPEISKRVILIRVNNRVNKTKAAYNSRTISLSQKKLTNAFYRLYLANMFDEVNKLVDKMEEFSAKNEKTWYPDIFSVSSKVIHQIFTSLDLPIPEEFPIFSWEDYMGDLIISEKAIQLLLDEYAYSPKMFSIDKKRNELIVDLSLCYDQRDMAQHKNTLIDELPADFECKESGNKVIMRLDKAQEHISFAWQEKGLLAKLKDKIFG